MNGVSWFLSAVIIRFMGEIFGCIWLYIAQPMFNNTFSWHNLQVFDGHGGTDAVCFVRKNLLKFIIEDGHFPNSMEKAIRSAFVKADRSTTS